MPPKNVTTESGSEAASFTEGDIKFLKAFFGHMSAEAKSHIDWAGMQTELSLTSAKVVKDKFRLLCKKHKWCDFADGKSGTKRTADDGDEVAVKTPKGKKQKAKADAEN